MPIDPSDIEEEQVHFSNIPDSTPLWKSSQLTANNRRRKDFYTLSQADQDLLASLGYKEKLAKVDEAILANAEFLNQIIANPEIFGHEVDLGDEEDAVYDQGLSVQPGSSSLVVPTQGHSHSHSPPYSHTHSHDEPSHVHSHARSALDGSLPDPAAKRRKYRPTDFDMDKLRSTLKQFVRDWSEEGKIERDVIYEPMKKALLDHFSDIPPEERSDFRVLVPGAGLGRLAWDIAHLGFTCQGNEFSHYMLLSSFFILNRTNEIGQHTIYPYVHSFSNLPNKTAMLRPISIPDVSPSALPPGSNFSLVAGDFEEIYGVEDTNEGEPQSGHWDAVMTCFFIDTAKNIVNYLRIIHRILAPGGVWINLGPLLWHFENNSTNDPSIELDLEEVKALARQIGFEISNERTIDATYTNNAQSMLGYVYHAAFWTAKKVL